MRTLAPNLVGVCTTCGYETEWVGEFEDFNAQLGICPKCEHELELFDGFVAEPEWLHEFESELEAEINRRSKTYIKWVQGWLNLLINAKLTMNGIADAKTRQAIKNFQRRSGIAVNGVVGAQTERALIVAGAFLPPNSPGYIRWAQGFLNKVMGTRLVINGKMEPKTENVVRNFQKQYKLVVDGIIGPQTEQALMLTGCKKFFREYELRFNPGTSFGIPTNSRMTTAQKTNRIGDVNAMAGELVTRRDARAVDALAGRIRPATPVAKKLAPIAKRLSAAQLNLYREWFPERANSINFVPFQRCFELFANGELRNPKVGLGFGEPDGAFYFLFAEFAFLCVDSKISKTAWLQALRVFIKTQEIFMYIYRSSPFLASPPTLGTPVPKPGAALRKLDDTGFRFSNFNAKAQSSLERKVKLRAKYDRMNLSNLRHAARDNLLRALRTP